MDARVTKRIEIAGVPVDSFDTESIEAFVDSTQDGKNHQIVLLSVWDLMRARRQGEYRSMIQGASLVLPVSPSIEAAARRLGFEGIHRHDPFEFVIKILNVLENRGKSVYLIGGTKKNLRRAETNIASTFPGLRVVGRFQGRYPKAMEASILEAIRKSTPTLILVGSGVPGDERWIPATLPKINNGIYLWCSDLFEVLAVGRGRPPRRAVAKNREWLFFLARKPWKILRFFIFLHFRLLTLRNK